MGARPGTAWYGRDHRYFHGNYYGHHPVNYYGYHGLPYPPLAHPRGELVDPSFYGAYRHVSPVRHIQNKKEGVFVGEPYDYRYRVATGSPASRKTQTSPGEKLKKKSIRPAVPGNVEQQETIDTNFGHLRAREEGAQ